MILSRQDAKGAWKTYRISNVNLERSVLIPSTISSAIRQVQTERNFDESRAND